MKIIKKSFSCLLAILMIFSVVSVGFTASAVGTNGSILKEIVLEPMARPKVTFTCTPVTRVALAANSMEPGTAIVKATPSGIPELSGAYAAQAYAGETPSATKISFQSNTVGVTPKNITCSNESVVLSDVVYNGSTSSYVCEIVSGTAEPGSAITFTIDYEWTDGNSYQEKCVTFVEGIANGGSYAEARSDIHALSGTSNRLHVYAGASTRILGTGVYYEQPAEIITSVEDPYRSYGVYNVATGTITDNVASGYNTSIFVDDQTAKPAGQMNMACEIGIPGTSLAHIYVDSSVTKTLADANIRYNVTVGALSGTGNDNPYTAIADMGVSSGSNVDNISTANDAVAQAAIGLDIPVKADYGVKQFQKNTSMTSITAGVGPYKTLFSKLLTGNVSTLVDGSTYTITSKYYSYRWYDIAALRKFNMTSAATVPVSMTFHIVDKGALRDLINKVMTSEPESPAARVQNKGANPQAWFYKSGFSQFQTSYTEALRVLNNPKATQAEIDAATKSLQTMYNGLTLKTADYTKVNELVDIAEEIVDNEECYYEDGVAIVEEALSMVKKNYNILYQNVVDIMAENLLAAINNVKVKPADYEGVYTAKIKAEALDEDDYTVDSWQNLQDAVGAIVYGKTALEQREVNAMADAINNAIQKLVKLSADLTALNAKLNEAKNIDISKYINGTIILNPIENAQAIVTENVSKPIAKERQSEVDALTKALDDAIKSLIPKIAYKDDLKAALDAEIPGEMERYDQDILDQYITLIIEGSMIYSDESLTIADQAMIDAKTSEIVEKYIELMASYVDACRHETLGPVVYENEVSADCTTEGSYDMVIYCLDCGEEFSRVTTTTPAYGHFEDEPVVENVVDAGCVTGGSFDTVIYCLDCGEEVLRVTTTTDALGHFEADAVKENEIPATCTTSGSYDSVVYCMACDEEIDRSSVEVDALGHVEGIEVKENEIPATCTTSGSYDSVVCCVACGEEFSRNTVEVDALGHTEESAIKENEIPATCTTAGSYDSIVYCSVCNEELSRNTVTTDALGHTESEAVEENRVEPTYDEAGSYDMVVYCSVCGEEVSRTTVEIPMLDGYFRAATGSTTVIDEELGFIYGLEIGLDDLEGYVEYSKSVSYETTDGIGTGMLLTTYRDGEIWATYTIIIFGDLNGDGVIDIYDASILAAIVNGDMELEEGDAILFAADLNGDTAVDIYDLAILNAVVNGETEISQLPLA